MMQIVPVILCGGEGRRLQSAPSALPKPFLPLAHAQLSLLQQTAQRALRLAPADHIITITAREQAELTHAQLTEVDAGLTAHLLAEPVRRNTAAAVALALGYARYTFGEEVMLLVLPADHWIDDDAVFAQQMQEAVSEDFLHPPTNLHTPSLTLPLEGEGITSEARRPSEPSAREAVPHVKCRSISRGRTQKASARRLSANNICLFGIPPTAPSEDYGYIMAGTEKDGMCAVERFVEKPAHAEAAALLAGGDAFWNSGIFLFSLTAGEALFAKHAPEFEGLIRPSGADVYDALPSLPFDKAIIEKTSDVVMQPARFGWLDVGTPERVEQLREKVG